MLLAVGATSVSSVATLLAPTRVAAALLGAWALASIVAWVDRTVEGDETGSGQTLMAVLVVGLGLAIAIGWRAVKGPRTSLAS